MSHLNHDVLDTLREALGESDFFEVVNTFVQQFEHQLQALEQRAECGELPECAHILHSLKGSAGNIGAQTLAERAHGFEQQVHAGEVSLQAMIETLSNTTSATITELRDSGYLGGNT